MCDLSYAVQVEALERQALTMMTLAPHLEDSSKIPTPEEVVQEFQQWLLSKPEAAGMKSEDAELMELIGVMR